MKRIVQSLALVLASSAVLHTVWAADTAPTKPERSQRHAHMDRLKNADTDKDGALSKAEVEAAKMPRLAERFDQLDTNKDGKISREEMQAMRQQHQDKRAAHMKDTQKMRPAGPPTEAPKP